MHILTKVFVLFAAVLSILLAALSISYTVNADRVTADYRDALSRADNAANDLAAVKSTSSNLIAAKEEELSAARDELATREADIRRLEAANSELRIGLRSAALRARLDLEGDHQEGDGDGEDDRQVRDVARREPYIAPAEGEEVGDAPVEQALAEVAEHAAEDEAGEQPRPDAPAGEQSLRARPDLDE